MLCQARIKARVGIIEEPKEFAGKFTFEIFVSVIDSGKEPEVLQCPCCFDTEEDAHNAMNATVKDIQKAMLAGDPRIQGFINMKTNIFETPETVH
jgi:hypothetical protein